MAPRDVMEYLNRYLPDDIRVLSAKIVPERFHSRLSATSKTYGYYVETGDKKNVFERKYVYGCGKKLDVKAMRQAAEFLIGEHDFKSFCANRRMKKSTVRRIDEIRIVEHGTKLEFLYTGNGFLYNMVRILTGTLLEVGSGTRRPEKMKEIIAEQLSVEAETVTEASSFKEDLGADSLDLFELVMALEDEYSVEIPAEDLEQLTTVGEVMNYLKAKGVEA